jgi:hypothetical protein
MLVFIDESGIHKENGHSVFAFVYIVVKNYPQFERDIIQLEKELRIEKFHWSETSWAVREKFFARLILMEFEVKVGIVENPIRPEKEFERLLLHMLVENKIQAVYIDGEKPKQYAKRIKKVLRDRGSSVRKLRMIHDEQSAGIRVADAMAGLTRAYFDGKQNLKLEQWYNRFRKKKIMSIFQ